jgi:hypothetical protein
VGRYVPPQHGAWAFLGLPLVLGALVSPWTPLLLVLAVAWVAAYPWSYAASGLVRARRNKRFLRPLVVWTAVVVPAAAVLLLARPWLVWVGVAYLALFAVNLGYARRRDERALLNDVVLVVECAAMVVVTWAVAVGSPGWSPPSLAEVPGKVWVLPVVCALVLLGSTLHVKALIRERRDPRYRRASLAVAAGSLVGSLVLAVWWGLPGGAWLVLPFLVLAVRAAVIDARTALRPARIGLIELATFVLTAVAAAAATAG